MLNTSPIDPAGLAQHLGGWIASRGPEQDVAISSRVRLARNLRAFHFKPRIQDADAERLAVLVQGALEQQPLDGDTRWVRIQEAPPLLRLLLRERYLCSRELAPAGEQPGADSRLAGRAVAFGVAEDLSVMVNEEDHLRMQALAPGFDLQAARERVTGLDRQLEQHLDYAWDSQLGYLTGCPTNVGTGLRASVMLHLPALGLVRAELEKVIRAAQRTGLAVRGIYGEGSRAVGDFYQISNQITLGRSEEQLTSDLESFVPSIMAFERRVRERLASARRAELEARVASALETLLLARSMPSEEALTRLSTLRLGQLIGLEAGPEPLGFGQLAIQLQKGHILALAGGAGSQETLGSPSERDAARASFLRRRFGRG